MMIQKIGGTVFDYEESESKMSPQITLEHQQ